MLNQELKLVEAVLEREQATHAPDFVFDYTTGRVQGNVTLACYHTSGPVYTVQLDLRGRDFAAEAQLLCQRLYAACARAVLLANQRRLVEQGAGGCLARRAAALHPRVEP